MSIARPAVVLAALLVAAPLAHAQDKVSVGSEAPDFPVGTFSDGKQYSLADLRGKVVVLFFYESHCPRCKGTIPERNEVVKAFKDKPIKFLAVGSKDPAGEVAAYTRETGLAMPAFVDSLGLMDARYGANVSLQNIWQFRVIGPDGKLIGMSMEKADLDKMVASAKPEWKFKGKGYPAKVEAAADAYEWGRYADGAKLLMPLRKAAAKDVAAAANMLFADVKAEAAGWKDAAAAAEGDDPVKAFDLYTKVAAAVPGDELAKAATDALTKLKAKKPVIAEVAARKTLADTEAKLGAAGPAQKKAAADLLKAVAKKHPNTPSAAKATAAAEELAK